jgi:hypothetical protein
MDFRTKLDFTTRQVRQYPRTNSTISGSTYFGVPFSALTSGPDLTITAITSTISGIVSTFSGNSATTVYTWYSSSMSLGQSGLSALTPSNSGITQNTIGFIPNTSTIIDGNTVNLTYTGVSFDFKPTSMNVLGVNSYSGSGFTNVLNFISAGTLDFTDRTIWVDVNGISRTDKLIVDNNAGIGKVLTCMDSEGMAEWQTLSGLTAMTSIWSAGTGTPSAVLSNSGGIANNNYTLSYGSATTASNIGSVAGGFASMSSGYFSTAIGGQTLASGTYCYAEGAQTTATTQTSHAEGFQTLASGLTSHAEGQNTKATGNISHAEGAFTLAAGLASHAEGYSTSAMTSYTHVEGFGTIATKPFAHAEGVNTEARGSASHAQGVNTIADGIASFAMGSSCKTSGDTSFAGGNLCTASGQTNFVFGDQSTATGYMIVVLGGGINGTQDNTTYVDQLNILTVGAGPGVTDIGIDALGNVVDQASDLSLKENINTIQSALDKVLKLRGVTYNWKNKEKGGDALKLGFIAQEVNDVIPELTYNNGEYMGVHYKDISALLVEAIKELASDKISNSRSLLETQTVVAEDNNIELNYNGNHQTSVGGGLIVLHGISDSLNSELTTDQNGDWTTNSDFKPKNLTIPFYTPNSTNDLNGSIGNITRDDDYLYVKTNNGWKRTNLESF